MVEAQLHCIPIHKLGLSCEGSMGTHYGGRAGVPVGAVSGRQWYSVFEFCLPSKFHWCLDKETGQMFLSNN